MVQLGKAGQSLTGWGWQEPQLCSTEASEQRESEPGQELVVGLGSGFMSPHSCQCSQAFSSKRERLVLRSELFVFKLETEMPWRCDF